MSVGEEYQVLKREVAVGKNMTWGRGRKWPDKSTLSYDMLDFKSCIKIFKWTYRLIKLLNCISVPWICNI